MSDKSTDREKVGFIHRIVAPARSNRARDIIILLIGLVLAFGAEPLADFVIGHYHQKEISWLLEGLGYGFEHLGFVLVVAMLVRVAIEEASERQFIDLVNDKVSKQIEESIRLNALEALKPVQDAVKKLDEELGSTIRRKDVLDDQSLKVLQAKVLNPVFIRSGYLLNLTLEPLTSPGAEWNDLIKVRVGIQYRIRNITSSTQEFPIEAWVDTMIEPEGLAETEKCQFTRFVCGPDETREDNRLRGYNLVKLNEDGKIWRDNGGLWLKHQLPGGLPANSAYYVEIDAVQVMRKQDVFVWNMGGLTSELTILVSFAGGYSSKNFHVDARELHHIGRENFAKTRKVDENDWPSWSIPQVLLPYQGVEIWWVPQKPGINDVKASQ